MLHRGSAVPRLVCMQGTFSYGGDYQAAAEPVYRHPADDQPAMRAWTPTVETLRRRVEAALGHTQVLNHALIQYYRGGADYISEHADKTLDVLRGSAIVNLSLGATRVMVLRGKKEALPGAPPLAGLPSAPSPQNSPSGKRRGRTAGFVTAPSRPTQRVSLPDGSLFVLGWQTNRDLTHEIR